MHKIRIYTKICMPNKQKMQNYDYFDILDFKDRSDRDRIAILPQDRDPLFFGSRSGPKIAIRFISDRDLGVKSRSKKNLDRDRSDRELQHLKKI